MCKTFLVLIAFFAGLNSLAPAKTNAPAHTQTMAATAYTGATKPTAAGTRAHKGTAAADPRVLPPGSKVRVSGAGPNSGVYLVTDKGRAIKGKKIDLYMPSKVKAKEFGKKPVTVKVLHTGKGNEDAREQARRQVAARARRP